VKKGLHTHPCAECGTPVDCHGEWHRNHDGFPEVICDFYHVPTGAVATMICEPCYLKSLEVTHAARIRQLENPIA